MAHIPLEDVRDIWEEAHSEGWPRIRESLIRHERASRMMSDRDIVEAEEDIRDLARAGEPVPDSPEGLYDLLNKRLAAVT